jgi:hypothetical protein
MTKPHGTDGAGKPVDLIGRPLRDTSASVPSVRITRKDERDVTMAKAERDGIYTLKGGRFKIRKGDVLPDGAVLDGAEPEVEERAEKSAPENKAKKAAPENRAAGKRAE